MSSQDIQTKDAEIFDIAVRLFILEPDFRRGRQDSMSRNPVMVLQVLKDLNSQLRLSLFFHLVAFATFRVSADGTAKFSFGKEL